MDKIIKLQFNTTVNKRVKVRTNCELYSHDKNNNEFELTIGNHTLTNEDVIILFKFVKSIKYWETQGKIEDNKIKFKFDTSLITDNERVNCYIILKSETKESDVYSFSFDVKMSEYDLKDNLPVKERYFANGVVVDKLDVLTKEVLAEELEKAKGTYALKTEIPSSETIVNKAIEEVEKQGYLTEHQSLNGYVTETQLEGKNYLTQHQSLNGYVTETQLTEKGYLTKHQDISGLATKKAVEAVENKVTQLENRPVTSSYDDSEIKRKLKELEDRPTTANIDTSNFVTTTQLEDKHYLTEHQSLTNYVTKNELKEEVKAISGSQPTVDTSNFATKEELRKAFLDEEEHEKYAKKTELPQPYNDTDIKGRLTTLENRPSGNVDTSKFLNKLGVPYEATGMVNVEDYLRQTLALNNTKKFGTLFSDEFNNHVVVTGRGKTAKFETLLYTIGSSLPDSYEPDFEFSENDNLKFITTQNIHNYLPTNTGNTTELDNRLKVLEAKQWEIHGRGMPNGVVTAPVGTTYVDEAVTNGALKWIKKTGTGNTGWEVLIGDTGWRTLPAVSKLGNSFVKVRRKNDTIFYQFGGLSWGWFGIVRRGGAGYQLQGSDRERNCYILGLNGVPQGFRSESSLIGGIYNDKGTPYGTWYLGGAGDSHMLRFQFTDPVPTDRDIGDIRVSSISYLTNDPWPQN